MESKLKEREGTKVVVIFHHNDSIAEVVGILEETPVSWHVYRKGVQVYFYSGDVTNLVDDTIHIGE